MADEMGSKELEQQAIEPESSYSIIAYNSQALPHEFLNLIKAPFLNSLRYGNELFKIIDKQSYFNNYSRFIDSILQRPKVIIRLSMLNDLTVLGWAMYELNILHYVWVKKEVRHQGIAKAMTENLEFTYFTHITNKGLSIWAKSHYQHLKFDPFL